MKEKKKYIPPKCDEKILECEDFLTSSTQNTLKTKTDGSGTEFVSVGSESWSNIYNK